MGKQTLAMLQERNTWQWRPNFRCFLNPKLLNKIQKDSEKPSTNKDDSTFFIEENQILKNQIWDNMDSKVYNVWLF